MVERGWTVVLVLSVLARLNRCEVSSGFCSFDVREISLQAGVGGYCLSRRSAAGGHLPPHGTPNVCE